MSVFPTGTQLRDTYYGVLVSGAAKALPATATGDIFTVAGGRVLLTSLVGVVGTALGATVTTLSVGVHPTGGASANTALCTAGTVTSLASGTQVALPQAVTSALVVGGASGVVAGGSSGGTGVVIENGGIAIVSAGTINITTSATDTGTITWTVTYIPYDVGASITAL